MAEPASILLYRWRSRQAEDLPLTGFQEVPICSKERTRPMRTEANDLQLYGVVLDWTKVLYSGYLASD